MYQSLLTTSYQRLFEICAFCGMLNFDCRHLEYITQVLLAYLKGSTKNDKSSIEWIEASIAQFDKWGQTFCNAVLLIYWSSYHQIALFADYQMLLLASRSMIRSCLPCYKTLQIPSRGTAFYSFHWSCPLTFAFKQTNKKATTRRLRHLQFISQFTINVQHVSGSANVVADYLSRQ